MKHKNNNIYGEKENKTENNQQTLKTKKKHGVQENEKWKTHGNRNDKIKKSGGLPGGTCNLYFPLESLLNPSEKPLCTSLSEGGKGVAGGVKLWPNPEIILGIRISRRRATRFARPEI